MSQFLKISFSFSSGEPNLVQILEENLKDEFSKLVLGFFKLVF